MADERRLEILEDKVKSLEERVQEIDKRQAKTDLYVTEFIPKRIDTLETNITTLFTNALSTLVTVVQGEGDRQGVSLKAIVAIVTTLAGVISAIVAIVAQSLNH